jgi:hypothetical protein
VLVEVGTVEVGTVEVGIVEVLVPPPPDPDFGGYVSPLDAQDPALGASLKFCENPNNNVEREANVPMGMNVPSIALP